MSSSSSSFSFVHCPRLLPLTLSPSFVHPLSRSSTRSFTEFILFLSHIVFFLSPSFLYLSQLDRLLPFLRAPSLIFSLSLSLSNTVSVSIPPLGPLRSSFSARSLFLSPSRKLLHPSIHPQDARLPSLYPPVRLAFLPPRPPFHPSPLLRVDDAARLLRGA